MAAQSGGAGGFPRTITGYALTVRDFIECFATEEDNPSAPSYADVLLWAQTFDARGLTRRTRQQYLVRLRTFFTWACEHGWYQVNPVLKRLLPAPSDLPPKEYAKLGKWQLQRLYTFTRPGYARTVTYPRNYAIVILLLTTDLRNNELLHLTPSPGWKYPGGCWEVGDDLVRRNHPLLPALLAERCAKYRHLLEQMDKSPRARASERYATYRTILEQLEVLENGRK